MNVSCAQVRGWCLWCGLSWPQIRWRFRGLLRGGVSGYAAGRLMPAGVRVCSCGSISQRIPSACRGAGGGPGYAPSAKRLAPTADQQRFGGRTTPVRPASSSPSTLLTARHLPICSLESRPSTSANSPSNAEGGTSAFTGDSPRSLRRASPPDDLAAEAVRNQAPNAERRVRMIALPGSGPLPGSTRSR